MVILSLFLIGVVQLFPQEREGGVIDIFLVVVYFAYSLGALTVLKPVVSTK
jgi:hypothetical protein